MPAEPTESEIITSHRDDAKKYFESQGGNLRTAADRTTAPVVPPVVAPVVVAAEVEDDFTAGVLAKKPVTPVVAPVVTAVEKDVFEGLAEPEAGSKHRPDWDKAKALAAQHRKEALAAAQKAAELEARLKSTTPAEADAATKARLADFEAQTKTLSDRLKIFDVQGHPDFQREFVQPRQLALAAAAETLKVEGVEADLTRLFSLKGKAFNEEASKISGKLTDFSQADFIAQLRKVQQLDAAAAATIANADQFREQKSKEFQSRIRGVYDEVTKVHAATFVPAVIPETATPEQRAVDEAWNKALVDRGVAAERYAFSNASEAQVAEVAHKAASYDLLVSQGIPRIAKLANVKIANLQAELKAAKAELAGMSRAAPRVGLTSEAPVEGAAKIEDQDHREAARSIAFTHVPR